MEGEEASDQHSGQEHKIPQPGLAPVIAEEFQLAWSKGRAEMTQVAGDAEDLVADEQQRGNEESNEWTCHIPGPFPKEPGLHADLPPFHSRLSNLKH